MVVLDTDVLLLAFTFQRDDRQSANTALKVLTPQEFLTQNQ